MNLHTRRHGTILIVTMCICFLLAGMVLVFCRSMRVEAIASANQVASVSASAIERGAEQYALAIIDQQKDQVYYNAESTYYGVQVGDGYFFFLRPNYGDDSLPSFGFTDEAGKVNINTATLEMLLRLPGMTDDLAAGIMDWRDEDSDISNFGAENEYYLSLPQPYYCKNAPFEAVEEVLLVRGATAELVYGQNYLLQGAIGRDQMTQNTMLNTDPALARGLYDLLTVYSIEPNTGTTTGGGGGTTGGGNQQQQPRRGLINVNTAPREVLFCLPGLEDSDVTNLLSARNSANITPGDISWVANAIQGKAPAIAQYITGSSYQYSANIVAVSGNGRGFKHVRIVVDARTSPAKIVYRRDLTDQGWPMDQQTLRSLRAGQGVPASTRPLLGGSL
ncbi:MAG TPA: helix-hairpin-helix domain-containing protein [Tepidisphaeraceae bacterium]|nr:helix-hairpin-helix domain-containing protein [Tepidisphaeraceae bacterium]